MEVDEGKWVDIRNLWGRGNGQCWGNKWMSFVSLVKSVRSVNYRGDLWDSCGLWQLDLLLIMR